jgi:ribonuclease HI
LVYTQEVKRVTEAKSVNQVSSVSKATKWIAPPPNMCKINVDAALAKSENKGAVAAVARSATGEFLGSSSVTVEGVSVPAILESLACREALALASDLNLRRIKVATDCLEVANCMRSQEHDRGIFSCITRECQDWAKQFDEAVFCHEGRASNGEAHRLARLSTSLEVGRSVWFGNPPMNLCIPFQIVE